jgi:hypothetical protein
VTEENEHFVEVLHLLMVWHDDLELAEEVEDHNFPVIQLPVQFASVQLLWRLYLIEISENLLLQIPKYEFQVNVSLDAFLNVSRRNMAFGLFD